MSGPVNHTAPDPDTECIPGISTEIRDEAIESAGSTQPRPFVERRRSRPVEQSWHEALEPIHRLLIRYEETQQQLIQEGENYRAIFEDAPVGIFQVSRTGRPLRVNRAMAQICGYDTPDQFLVQVSHVGEQLLTELGPWSEFAASLEANRYQFGLEVELHARNAVSQWVQLHMQAVRDDQGSVLHYEGTCEDITERKRAQERIHFLAYYDAVTGLPNRPLFEERLAEALAAARARAGRSALFLVELDRFKIINDSLGESFGDRLLQGIAERIQAAAGEGSTVARIAGAEFAIILPYISDVGQVQTFAQKIIATLSSEFTFLGHSLNVSCNMGVSLFPDDGKEGDALLKHADVAMYSAREQGPNELRFFTEEMNVQIRERLKIENGLRMALERNELFLVYQPQVDIRTGAITGLEALLRWQHPQLGLVPPARFIGVAEASGLIVPIGEWVLRTACTQARQWQMAGLPPVPVAVNVSAMQFRHQGFGELIRSVLHETGLEPKYLELELTEGLLLTNADVMFNIVQELREMGVKLAIDDFGTGYSSLGYLRQFKVNRLKIDRSFVRDVPVNADDAAITTAIINMAKALNLDVLAEGVENAEQLAFLRAQNCFEIQGYYFSKPVPVEQIAQQLQSTFVHSA